MYHLQTIEKNKNHSSPKFYGTIKYCPPEALKNTKFRALDGDIWALGIVLYTLAHGGNPFADVKEILNAPLEIDNFLSLELEDLIRSILNRNVRKRFSLQQIQSHLWMSKDFYNEG